MLLTAHDPPKPASRRYLRIGAWIAVVLVVVGVLALIADDFAASRAEHRLARAVQASPGVPFEPDVIMAGFPFLAHRSEGNFSSVLISADGVPIEGCSGVPVCTSTVDARLQSTDLGPTGDLGPRTELRAQSMRTETRINSPTLGRLMGIVDLYINTPAPEDKVGGGGPGDGLLERTEGIMLSGTVPLPGSPETQNGYPPSAAKYTAPKVKVSVKARVSVVDGRVRIEATDFYTGPEEHYSADVPEEFRSAVLKRFSTTLPALQMAWGTTAKHALSRGSDLVAVSETGPVSVRAVDYAKPLPSRP
ncbi:DUF2993 domain-containing protein [Gordonia sp. PS3]|uniref:DUF2993 domain-containing protein n=1 Tax=Gordonia sihwensis NBRC 108236 TaxID=1223544 RepID=L7LJX8_9ACTN|nr:MULTISPECIES: DUF2993 domain-containing protein [Gordonia]MBY4569249.1 hypothetical protein [Gordonia sihwensis]WFN92160.1 DUF2993 domain-containing protein [Gordonia sihwensis]GAC60358.1 hypothetical protein GSI01S_09_00200 [Gordonia sihwensis NBRC 108236]